MAGGHPLLTGGLTTPKKATQSPQLGTSQGGAAMSLVRGPETRTRSAKARRADFVAGPGAGLQEPRVVIPQARVLPTLGRVDWSEVTCISMPNS